jgi:hypothetical protein
MERFAGLAFDFHDAPVLVCLQHERFPNTISITLCAVRSDGSVTSMLSTTLLDRVSGYSLRSHAANPTLMGTAPANKDLGMARSREIC